jgi:excisionase family DNA binding protein
MTDDPPKEKPLPPAERLLSVADVAAMFSVDPKTVTKWADRGKVEYIRTPGGHRKFPPGQFKKLLTPRRGKWQAQP